MIRDKNLDPRYCFAAQSVLSIPTVGGGAGAQAIRIPWNGVIVSAHHCVASPVAEDTKIEVRRAGVLLAEFVVPAAEDPGVIEIVEARGVKVAEGEVISSSVPAVQPQATPHITGSITMVVRPNLGQEK